MLACGRFAGTAHRQNRARTTAREVVEVELSSVIVKSMANRFPPFDFPLYGLDATWTGPRWLDFFEGRAGSPSWGAWLGHGHDPDRKQADDWVIVGSFPVRRSIELQLQPGETFEHYLASVATLVLFNDSVEGPARLEAEPDRWSEWPSTSVMVDGRSVSGHVVERGSAWAAFITGLDEVGLVIHASGNAGQALSMVEVTDSGAYHFNSDVPLDYPAALHASREAAFEG
jgi:hypothetical protein